MRRLAFYICLCAFPLAAWALTIPQGTIYFDNSRTAYAQVFFCYGSNLPAEMHVREMTFEGDTWRVDIPITVQNMYRFTFVGASIRQGDFTQDFNAFKDSVSHQLGINRTATSAAQMNSGDIYVPQTGDNWAQGDWMTLAAWKSSQGSTTDTKTTGTLPVVYVNTANKQAITDTETKIPATVYIDSVVTQFHALGSQQAPIPATIKGRGNWTWSGFDKKPYKLKFDVKQKVLGMPNNRHWCLLAYADDYLGYLKGPVGFMLSKAIGLRWTPRYVPVELVLNDKYMGLYFLTEHVRIAANRVRIREQAENETHFDSITGGWLVEIDNYATPNNITFYEGNGQEVMVSLREPELLSSQQRTYIENQMYTLNDALYSIPANQKGEEGLLPKILDMDEAAKYYLVQEIMEDCESYHGSCFLYKDRDSLGVTDKWKFGPVWDFGNAYDRQQERFIYDSPTWPQYWVGQLAQWPVFQQKVQEQWYRFYHDYQYAVRNQIDAFVNSITSAAVSDAALWTNTRNYQDNSRMNDKRQEFLYRFNRRIQWLYSQWGEGIPPTDTTGEEQISAPDSNRPQSRKILIDGHLYILRDNKKYTPTGMHVE